jgi:hypothetical protein
VRPIGRGIIINIVRQLRDRDGFLQATLHFGLDEE